MSGLSPGQEAYLAYQAGFPPNAVATIVAIDQAEDPGGDPTAMGDVSLEDATWGPSVGPNQIRTLKADTGKGTNRDIKYVSDPLDNYRAALAISSGGKDFSAWSTWWGNAEARTGPGQGPFLSYIGTGEQAAANPVPVNDAALAASSAPSTSGVTVTPTAGFSWSDLLPWNWAGDLAGSAASATANALAPVGLTIAFVLGGLALVVGGIWKMANPNQSLRDLASQARQAGLESGALVAAA